MRAPLYFKRGKGVGVATDAPAIGTATDPIPTNSTARRAPTASASPDGPSLTPSFEFRDLNSDRVFVGYWYSDGAGPAVTIPVALYVWDDLSKKYYKADSGTLTNGQLTYLKCPCPISPSPNQAALTQPNNAQHCLVIVSDNASPDGVLHFIAGPDAANA